MRSARCISSRIGAAGRGAWLAAALVSILPALAPDVAAGAFRILDRFDRVLNSHGIVLVDWEGHLANPALEFRVAPPADASFPLTATLAADGARLYFDQPCTVGAGGPVKTLVFADAAARPGFRLSIFPDRDALDEVHLLSVRAAGDASVTTLPIRVVDQDRARPADFQVTIDFSRDLTGFFTDPTRRAVVQQAADDWAYFLGDMHLAVVSPGDEWTFIWDTNAFTTGDWTQNGAAYRGFLLYGYGVFTPEKRSGGEPSQHAFQSSNSVALPLRRSGGYEAEVRGNYNTLGWFVTGSDEDWWVSGNLGHETNDLYSIAHHEIGHALFFNPGYPVFAGFKQAGEVSEAAVVDYQGASVPVDAFDHFAGVVDRLSAVGVFGNEYFGGVPRRRWLPTKLDLLNARAIGYALRPTSPFVPLTLVGGALPDGMVGQSFSNAVGATGGIPFYHYELESGALPEGVHLDSFTGAVTGTPSVAGNATFKVRVADYDPATSPVSAAFTLTVHEPPVLIPTLLPDGRITLDWKPATAGFVLQEAARAASGVWVDVPGGTVSPVTLPAAEAARFYRLRRPGA